jgi:hypothetical protein
MATAGLREIECTPIAYSGCFHQSRLFVGFLMLGRIGSIGIGELLRGRGTFLEFRAVDWLIIRQ